MDTILECQLYLQYGVQDARGRENRCIRSSYKSMLEYSEVNKIRKPESRKAEKESRRMPGQKNAGSRMPGQRAKFSNIRINCSLTRVFFGFSRRETELLESIYSLQSENLVTQYLNA